MLNLLANRGLLSKHDITWKTSSKGLQAHPSGHLVSKWRYIDVDATSSRRIDVNTTSFWHQMPTGIFNEHRNLITHCFHYIFSHWYAYSPIGANEWGNPSSSYVTKTNCYSHISSLSNKQGGDIIAFPSSAGSGHVGIVSSGGNYISAQRARIEEKSIPSGRTTVLWRYTC